MTLTRPDFKRFLKLKLHLKDDVFIDTLIDNIDSIKVQPPIIFENVGYPFWIYLKTWFSKKEIITMLSISHMSFYNLDKHFKGVSGYAKIGNGILSKLELLKTGIKWYLYG